MILIVMIIVTVVKSVYNDSNSDMKFDNGRNSDNDKK